MSYATDAILRALHFEPSGGGSFLLDPATSALGASTAVLRAALGTSQLRITDAVESPAAAFAPALGVVEVVALRGSTEQLGGADRVYLEMGLAGGEVKTLLLVVQPQVEWRLSTRFPGVVPSAEIADPRFRGGVVIASFGLRGGTGRRAITATEDSSHELDLGRYDLADGFRIADAELVDPDAELATPWPPADRWTGESGSDLAAGPDQVQLFGDVGDGWLQLECWWDRVAAPVGLGASATHRAGVAVRYDLRDPSRSHRFWLRAFGASPDPIVLEAYDIDNFGLQYQSRPGARIALRSGLTALTDLIELPIPVPAELTLPDSLALTSLGYTPGESVVFTVCAGDRTAADAHIVQLGPLELTEVDFAFAIPLEATTVNPTVHVTGSLEIADVGFRVNLEPWSLVEGALEDPDGVHLGRFLADALPVELPFGLESVTLRTATVQRLLAGGADDESTTVVKVLLDGRVELLPGLVIDDVGLDITARTVATRWASSRPRSRWVRWHCRRPPNVRRPAGASRRSPTRDRKRSRSPDWSATWFIRSAQPCLPSCRMSPWNTSR